MLFSGLLAFIAQQPTTEEVKLFKFILHAHHACLGRVLLSAESKISVPIPVSVFYQTNTDYVILFADWLDHLYTLNIIY